MCRPPIRRCKLMLFREGVAYRRREGPRKIEIAGSLLRRVSACLRCSPDVLFRNWLLLAWKYSNATDKTSRRLAKLSTKLRGAVMADAPPMVEAYGVSYP